MTEMTVIKRERSSSGSCNFCSSVCKCCDNLRDYRFVYEVTSPLPGGIQVRFCEKCLKKLKKGVK